MAPIKEYSPLLKNKGVQQPNYSRDDPELASGFVQDDSKRDSYDGRYPFRIEIDTSLRKSSGRKKSLWSRIDPLAFQFAIRMAVMLTISSLFVLVKTEDFDYPDGMWVLVSVLFVCWFPALDAASVIEKIVQRLIGTFVGAFLGLGCGFMSLFLLKTHTQQAVFLGCCTFVFNFAIVFFAGQCKVGRLRVIRRFAYATILCVLTFCICMLPFAADENPKWHHGVIRVINVIVGCSIGAIGSIVVCPKSTTDVLHGKAARQVTMAGEASEAVLHMASDFFAGRIEVNRLADELINTPLESELKWKLLRSSSGLSSEDSTTAADATDVALKKYEDAIADWKVSKALFPLTKYDPFHLRFGEENEKARDFHREIARTLARALRIQTTIVVLDGMVRSDADYHFGDKQLESFAETGSLIREMLRLPLSPEKNKAAAKELFQKLDETRTNILKMSTAVSDIEEIDNDDREQGLKAFQESLLNGQLVATTREEEDELGRGIPKNVMNRDDNTLFFLQLVEHLILRSLRLYQAWQHVEPIRKE